MIKITKCKVNFHNIEELCKNDSIDSSVSDLSKLCEDYGENLYSNEVHSLEVHTLSNNHNLHNQHYQPAVDIGKDKVFINSVEQLLILSTMVNMSYDSIHQPSSILRTLQNLEAAEIRDNYLDRSKNMPQKTSSPNVVSNRNFSLIQDAKNILNPNSCYSSCHDKIKTKNIETPPHSPMSGDFQLRMSVPILNVKSIKETIDPDVENGKTSLTNNESKKNADRRNRRIYKDYELQKMEQIFLKCEGYPGRDVIFQLSRELNLGEERVRNWFQNRRAKSKKIAKHGNKSPLESISLNTTKMMFESFCKNDLYMHAIDFRNKPLVYAPHHR